MEPITRSARPRVGPYHSVRAVCTDRAVCAARTNRARAVRLRKGRRALQQAQHVCLGQVVLLHDDAPLVCRHLVALCPEVIDGSVVQAVGTEEAVHVPRRLCE
eukprot:111637-Prymnesium_polylepis.1